MKNRCDIILLSYENPDLLKKCVESVLDHTKTNSTLIIVDNSSRDPEVRRYLSSLKGNHTVNVEKVFSEKNSGFSAGMNKGMRLSDAPFLCLLNNDCVVTEGWLEEMISVAESNDRIGLVNPQSNTFGSLPDRSISVDEHAGLLSDKKGLYVELGHAIGFACIIKRQVVDSVGYLDEEYEGVCYEDTDLSLRAQRAGYLSVMAEGAYVFHHEQASRKTLKGKEEIYSRNRAIFEKKWGKITRVLFMDRDKGLPWGKQTVRSDYEALKALARKRVFIDMWVCDRTGALGPEEAEECHVYPRHADIGVRIVRDSFAGILLIWKVLTKKKKYDALILRKGFLALLLKFLGSFRGTRVYLIDGGTKIRSLRGMRFDIKEPEGFVSELKNPSVGKN